MRRLLPLLLGMALMAPLAACGERAGSTVAAADVGGVCPTTSHGEGHTRLSEYVSRDAQAPTASWLRVRGAGQVQRGARTGDAPVAFEAVRFDAAERLAGQARSAAVTASVRAVDEALSELGRDSGVVVVAPADSPARVLAAVRSDGSVAFLGECAAERFTASFASFAAQRRGAGDTRSPSELFLAFPTDAALVADFVRFERPAGGPLTWADRKPEQRVIDPDGSAPPPPVVMAELKGHLLHFAYPAHWRTFDASVATFVPGIGWNPALPLRLASDDPAVTGYVSATRPLEVWLLPSPGDISRPLARVAVVAPGALPGPDAYFVSRVDAATLDELVAKARAGTAAFGLKAS